jgi:lysyl-tRNA synthetase class 2
MMVVIEENSRSVFPELAAGVLRVDGFVAAAGQVDMTDLDSRVRDAVARGVPTTATWRSVYQRMGLKPSKFPSSVEALTKRAAKSDAGWKTGRNEIDVYNAISIIHGAPLGCYDADRIGTGQIVIRPVDRNRDRFHPVGGSINISKGGKDLLVYAIQDEILCWALNYRDSATFCLRPQTRSVIVASESVTPDQQAASRAAVTELAEILGAHGAKCA